MKHWSEKTRIEWLKDRVRTFPSTPGVYLMKSATEKIIYVGKAKSLRSRVRSYFSESPDLSPKTKFLVRNIHQVEYILTNHRSRSCFCWRLHLPIKKHRPRYNIRLKDDKS